MTSRANKKAKLAPAKTRAPRIPITPRPLTEEEKQRALPLALALVTILFTGARVLAAQHVGFGDSEALYASYSMFPAPAYLDHPGLVGQVANIIGQGAVPLPSAAHTFTTIAAMFIPWLAVAAARAAGAPTHRAAAAGLAIAVVPETAVGLFALTPDLLLCILWLCTLVFSATALRAPPKSMRAVLFFLAAGVVAGLSITAKITGIPLFIALAIAYASKPARAHAKTPWPWLGLAAGVVIASPLFMFEADHGWPMLRHRLISTQAGAGFSLRNVGALFGGQLAYLSPMFAYLAWVVGRDLVKRRNDDATSRLYFLTFAVPLVILVPLCLWSKVAEPHWIAPALLALCLHYTCTPTPLVSPRIAKISVWTAMSLSIAVYAWVLAPPLLRLMPASYDPKVDIANELYGWPAALGAVREAADEERGPDDPDGSDFAVIGPHWTICAQLRAGLPKEIPVGCATPLRDDFDDWLPRTEWQKKEHILYVTDDRYPIDPKTIAPNHVTVGDRHVRVVRGGKVSRTFDLHMLDRRAQTLNDER